MKETSSNNALDKNHSTQTKGVKRTKIHAVDVAMSLSDILKKTSQNPFQSEIIISVTYFYSLPKYYDFNI